MFLFDLVFIARQTDLNVWPISAWLGAFYYFNSWSGKSAKAMDSADDDVHNQARSLNPPSITSKSMKSCRSRSMMAALVVGALVVGALRRLRTTVG